MTSDRLEPSACPPVTYLHTRAANPPGYDNPDEPGAGHADVINRLAGVFRPYGWSDESVSGYLLGLGDLDLGDLTRAAIIAVRVCERMPTAAELRRIVAHDHIGAAPTVDEAWAEISWGSAPTAAPANPPGHTRSSPGPWSPWADGPPCASPTTSSGFASGTAAPTASTPSGPKPKRSPPPVPGPFAHAWHRPPATPGGPPVPVDRLSAAADTLGDPSPTMTSPDDDQYGDAPDVTDGAHGDAS